MADDRRRDLILKYLRDELSPLEQIELQEWLDAAPMHQQVLDELSDPERLQEDLVEFHLAPARVRAKLDALLRQETFAIAVSESPTPFTETRRLSSFRLSGRLRPYMAAASLLLLVMAIWLIRRHRDQALLVDRPTPTQDITPGGNKATLTLSDGATVVLENAGNGTLTHQGTTAISKDSNRLAYTTAATAGSTTSSPTILYNILTTPRAGQYQVLLPDGTQVFLNNASSLRYPTLFTGRDRQVSLTGEAYFIVAKNASRPFIIHTDQLTVHVLGTSVDISAYTDEEKTKATLVDGAVSLQTAAGQLILHPGEQGITLHNGKLSVQTIDADESIAWTKGYFHFTHETITDVLRQLSRWYDISVEMTIPVPDYTYDGEIGRDLSLSSILKHLEKPDLHFRIEDRKLIVTH